MILTVDIGNTNTVVGIFKGEELIESVRLESNRSKTVDEYHLLLTDLLDLKAVSYTHLTLPTNREV